MDFAIRDRHGFDKDVWHIRAIDPDLMHSALTLQSQHDGFCTKSIHRSNEQQNRAVGLVRVDLQLDLFARLILLLLGDQFQVVKSIATPIIRRTTHKQHIATFHLVAFAVGDLHADAELACDGCLEFE